MEPGWETEIPDALADLLHSGGISENEMQAYRHLLRRGSASPTEIARAAGQSRGRIYTILRTLVERGYAVAEPVRPLRFRAVPLADVVGNSLRDLEVHAAILRQAAEQLAAPEADGPTAEEPLRGDDIALFPGRRAVMEELRRMVQASRARWVLGGGGRLGQRVAQDDRLLQAIGQAVKRGIRIDVVLPVEATPSQALERLRTHVDDGDVRVVPEAYLAPLTYAATEDVGFFVFPRPDDESTLRGEDFGIRVRHPKAAAAVFHHFEAPARPAAAGGLVDLDTIDRRFMDALSGAHQEVLAMGTRDWPFMMEGDERRMFDLFRLAREHGTRMRAVMEADADAEAAAGPFAELWEIRIVDWVPGALIIIDEAELFQGFRPREGDTNPKARYSNEPHELAHYIDQFHRLWATGHPLRGAGRGPGEEGGGPVGPRRREARGA